MTKKLYIILFLFIFKFSSGQTYNIDDHFSISIPKRSDWRVTTKYCDTIHNVYQFFQLFKDIKSSERKFSDVTIKYEVNAEDITKTHDINGCDFGRYTKIDTTIISGYKVKRWFGEDCGWTNENPNDKSIAGYSIDLIINLGQNKYIRISSDYFSSDKNELELLKKDLVNFINDFQIKKNK